MTKILQIYFCVKRQAKNDFLKEVESTVFLSSSCFVEISELNANNADPDQTPRSAASDLGLHFLLMSLL